MSEQPTPEATEMEKGIKKQRALNALRSCVMSVGEEADMTTLPIFIGQVGEVHNVIFRTAVQLNACLSAERAELEGGDKKGRDTKALRQVFEESCKEHFPNMPEDEITPMLMNYLKFVYRYADRNMMREDNLPIGERNDFGNTIPGINEGDRTPLMTRVTPSNKKELSVSERMRRNLRGARNSPDAFNILLLNSLVLLRVEIPTAPDLIRLMNSIATRLRNYGERYNVTSIMLERAGIAELLVDFVLDRVKYHSMKDVGDLYELKRYILANDINTIVMTLLGTTAPKGLSFRMYCLANTCQHNELVVVDPTGMVLDVEEDMSEERRRIAFELVHKGLKLSREDLAKHAPVYKDENGEPIDTRIPVPGVGQMVVAIPTLEEYFDTFHAMRDGINPQIRDLAVEFPNPKDFMLKRRELLAGIRGSEFTQWISAMEYNPVSSEDTEVEVILRSEDPRGFDQGLMANFSDDEDLYVATLQRLVKIIPRMTYTFVGIANDTCSKCGKTKESPDHEMVKGFTPIDPIMNFFDRTRMMIGMLEQTSTIVEDSLS